MSTESIPTNGNIDPIDRVTVDWCDTSMGERVQVIVGDFEMWMPIFKAHELQSKLSSTLLDRAYVIAQSDADPF